MRHANATRGTTPRCAGQTERFTIQGRRLLTENGNTNCRDGGGRSRPNWQSHEKAPTLMRGVTIGCDMQARRNSVRASREY